MTPPPPYSSIWVDPNNTWTTNEDMEAECGEIVPRGSKVTLVAPEETSVEGGWRVTLDGRKLGIPVDMNRADAGMWSAKEHRTPLAAIGKDTPFRQLGMYANMKGVCDEQLEHIKRNVESGITCMSSRKKARLDEVMLAMNIAVRGKAECGLQYRGRNSHCGKRPSQPRPPGPWIGSW